MPDVLICVAVDAEACDLAGLGSISGTSVEVLTTGIGPVNAAVALTRFLAHHRVGTVISLGIGGAYPLSGLQVGKVACAASETYADLGADSPLGFLDMEALGFPVVGDYFNRLPLDLFPTSNRLPFVTRTTCTGRTTDAQSIWARTGGAVESMEGAAIVHTALAHGVPVAEVRGISNMVGDRDRTAWRITEAAQAACDALIHWIEEGKC